MTNIERILSLCEVHDMQIISFGLAPNPNGFCYELGDTPASASELLDSYLDELTSAEQKELRAILFG